MEAFEDFLLYLIGMMLVSLGVIIVIELLVAVVGYFITGLNKVSKFLYANGFVALFFAFLIMITALTLLGVTLLNYPI